MKWRVVYFIPVVLGLQVPYFYEHVTQLEASVYIRFTLCVFLVLLSILGFFPVSSLSKDQKIKVIFRQIGVVISICFLLILYLVIFDSANVLARIDQFQDYYQCQNDDQQILSAITYVFSILLLLSYLVLFRQPLIVFDTLQNKDTLNLSSIKNSQEQQSNNQEFKDIVEDPPITYQKYDSTQMNANELSVNRTLKQGTYHIVETEPEDLFVRRSKTAHQQDTNGVYQDRNIQRRRFAPFHTTKGDIVRDID